MALRVSDQQLDGIEHGRETALIVQSKSTRKEYAVIAGNVFRKMQPLLQFVALQIEAGSPSEESTPQWTEENNARRVELINKKFDRGLTALEKKELAALNAEAEQYRDQSTAARTGILELILTGLKQQASTQVTG